ncbi:oxygen-independent coproporphyrinogen III oxidase [Pedomonas mirosovicensis]|uniref:oxygen-independent coproporphyrinogen III oxidase n=1 Tax=Pedomonas mirosovicensis TaxID=2908641 RepID=UPI002169EB79|nr:oxygen-independent coproporphyrinogen III oxidase [Pedomonas mirosovicensis]MCH8686659.1 oxygen-independent coproporphyrinogen III oxidase [Pedomonas mirosovicensis]
MTPDVVLRYADRLLPRYTSYPTAPHFTPAIGADDYTTWLATVPEIASLSLYFHVPFCRSMCWYCGCHTSVTRRDGPIARYMDALREEVILVARQLGNKRGVTHIHFGGGTPTLMHPEDFLGLMELAHAHFPIAAEAEIAIEIDPRTLTPEMIAALASGGVTRASLGVQSFDEKVQRTINRVQTFGQTAWAAESLRLAGIRVLNLDLLYGLPEQTVSSCRQTAEQALALMPDRLAVFGYAHVPSFKPHQRKFMTAILPDGPERHAQAEEIAATLEAAGYERIGLDHYARPQDPLAVAAKAGTLRRNFQGYTTDSAEVLIGFGASSIGRLPTGFVQNAVTTSDYLRAIKAGALATGKGYRFTAEDRLRAAVIERVMCDYAVDLDAMCQAYDADPDALLATAAPMIDMLVADGIAERQFRTIRVRHEARPLVRAVAAAFDQFLGQGSARHARAV